MVKATSSINDNKLKIEDFKTDLKNIRNPEEKKFLEDELMKETIKIEVDRDGC